MTLDEVRAAGINTSAPENQFVYKFNVVIKFDDVELPVASKHLIETEQAMFCCIISLFPYVFCK